MADNLAQFRNPTMQRVTSCSRNRLCVALLRSVTLSVLCYHLYSWPWDIIVYTSRILVDTLVFFINWILCVLHLFRITNSSACSVCFYFAIIWRREQSFVGAQTVVSLLQTTQIISDVCFITDHVASPAQIQLQVWTETELSFFLPGVDVSHVYVRALALGRFYSHISTRTFRRALTASLVMMMMKWCLMSSGVGWHIRDKLSPMPKHGSINLYVHGSQKAR